MAYRRIIVGLDGSDYSRRATSGACRHAKGANGTVIGVAIIDTPAIEARSRGAGVGASGFAKMAREAALQDAREQTTTFLAEFEKTCQEQGVKYETYQEEGAPYEILAYHGRSADLIVLGLETYFHFETEEGPGDTLREVIQTPVCPIVAVPNATDRLVENVLIAYDGSPRASQALHAYTMLHSGGKHRFAITVLRVGANSPEAQAELAQLHKYFEAYGLQMRSIVREGDPTRVILDEAAKLDPVMIVIGSRGRSGIKKFFLGSTAEELIRDKRFSLFIYS